MLAEATLNEVKSNTTFGDQQQQRFIRLLEMLMYLVLKVKITGSSRPEVFCKKDFLRNFSKFTRKYLCLSLIFNKVEDLRPATLLKKDSGTGVFL